MAAAVEGRPDVEFSVLRLFTQPSVPDVRGHLLSRDVLLVEGGSVVNLRAVWRAHGLAEIIRECWEAGVVLAGWRAGRLLPLSKGGHGNLDRQPRRQVYHTLLGEHGPP